MESTLDTQLHSAVTELEGLIGNLAQHDRKFAESLISGPYGYKKRGYLSEKQAPFIFKMLEKATGMYEAPEPINLGISRIKAMFEKAKVHLKWPKIVFETSFGKIKMYVQGPNAKYPGSVVFTLNKLWMGRIHTDGGLQKSTNFHQAENKEQFLDLLEAFSTDPEGVASKYGKLNSRCVFCGKALSDPKSPAVGYGGTCAAHYGLAWGESKLTTPEVLS